jgi:nucleoside-diphosphate-sugar epimerase
VITGLVRSYGKRLVEKNLAQLTQKIDTASMANSQIGRIRKARLPVPQPEYGYLQPHPPSSRQKTVAITGSPSGRVAQNLLEEYEKLGHRVVFIGRKQATEIDYGMKKSYDSIVLDLNKHISSSTQTSLAAELNKHKVDAVMHLAAYSGDDRRTAFQVNVEGSMALANAVQMASRERGEAIPLLIASSSAATICKEAQESGLNLHHQSYGDSKAELGRRIEESSFENVHMLGLDVMVPDDGASHVLTPLNVAMHNFMQMRVGAGDSILFPMLMSQAAKSITAVTQETLEGKEVPEYVFIGGDPITCSDLASKIAEDPLLSITLDPESLPALGEIVNSGVLTKGFMELAASVPPSVLNRAITHFDPSYIRDLEGKYGIDHIELDELVDRFKKSTTLMPTLVLATQVLRKIPISKYLALTKAVVHVVAQAEMHVGPEFGASSGNDPYMGPPVR